MCQTPNRGPTYHLLFILCGPRLVHISSSISHRKAPWIPRPNQLHVSWVCVLKARTYRARSNLQAGLEYYYRRRHLICDSQHPRFTGRPGRILPNRPRLPLPSPSPSPSPYKQKKEEKEKESRILELQVAQTIQGRRLLSHSILALPGRFPRRIRSHCLRVVGSLPDRVSSSPFFLPACRQCSPNRSHPRRRGLLRQHQCPPAQVDCAASATCAIIPRIICYRVRATTTPALALAQAQALAREAATVIVEACPPADKLKAAAAPASRDP